MPNPPRALSEILAPVSEAEFFEQYLGREFLLCKGWPGKFAGLLPWPDLNRILSHNQLDTPRLRLVREGQTVPFESYASYISARRPAARRPRLRAPDLTNHLQQGATLIVDSVDEVHEPITDLAEELERSLQSRIQVNMYAGWRTSRGFDLHWDGHDVLILQVAGRKQWGIYGVTREWPLPGDASKEAKTPPKAPVWEGMLEEGDLLYIPRGWWHVAVPLDEPTLHLTVGLHHPTGMDFIEWFTSRLKDNVALRKDLPRFRSQAEREEHLSGIQKAIFEAWKPELLDEYFASVDSRSASRPHFALPWSATAAALPQQDSGWAVKWIVPRPVDWNKAVNGSVRIHCGGKQWTFAPEAAPLLEMLQERRVCHIDEIVGASGNVTRDAARAFITELLNAGLVAIAYAHSE